MEDEYEIDVVTRSNEDINSVLKKIGSSILSVNMSYGIIDMLCLFCLARAFTAIETMEFSNSTKILQRLLKGYNKGIIPYHEGRPVDVFVQIYISDMVPLKALHMHYSVDFFLRQCWYDERLAYNKSNNETVLLLPGGLRNDIWIPDLYFPFGKEARVYDITTLNSAIHIYGDGMVFYSQRISLTSFCAMDLKYFPFDVQTCDFLLGSYAYTTDFIHLEWNKANAVVIANNRFKLYMREFSNVEFTAGNSVSGYEGIGKTKGKFQVLRVKFRFSRNVAAHVLRDYVPCILTVVLSWLSFWIDYRSTPSRVALGVTTALTMVTLLTSSNNKMDSHVMFRSMDLYLFVCNIYVFSVVVEFAVVGIMEDRDFLRSGKSTKGLEKVKEFENGNLTLLTDLKNRDDINKLLANGLIEETNVGNSSCDASTNGAEEKRLLDGKKPWRRSQSRSTREEKEILSEIAHVISNYMDKKSKSSHRLDRICRIVYPLSFILLNAVYFSFHCIMYNS